MFSGIVETTSPVLRVENGKGQRILSVGKPHGWKLRRGESVSVEGVCSTVERSDAGLFALVYMPETLRRTTLGDLRAGDPVNLERSLTLSDRVGGHLVQGHIDTTAEIRAISEEGEARIFEFEFPARYSRYVVEKGSIAVDGVSLTVVEVGRSRFTVSLLAYTLEHTTLGKKGPGARVNLEFDLLAKYVEKLVKR